MGFLPSGTREGQAVLHSKEKTDIAPDRAAHLAGESRLLQSENASFPLVPTQLYSIEL